MRRRGAEPDELVRRWFKLLKLPGVKIPDAECQAALNEKILKHFYHKFALALCTTNKAFSSFNNPAWTDFFKQLRYTILTR